MTSGRLLGKGISFPPRVEADGHVAWSEGEVNVREAIQIILLTEQRERLRLSGFGGGLKRFLFEPNTVTTRSAIRSLINRELAQWEPRIVVESVEVEADEVDPQAAIATIAYRLVATQVQERTSMSVRLGS
jgi:phage baseplate assembly protein W